MKKEACISCGKETINMRGTARFLCPNCSKTEMIRCSHCREVAAKYTCSSCGFLGPN